MLLGLLAAADEPIAGGRHKVFGHADLAVIPQTSTIASHLPRAMGVAFAIGRAGRLGLPTRWPADALAVCSFGDASLNHSTAQGALNAAAYTAHQGMPMPLLFVCEDNGLGHQRADAGRLGRGVAVAIAPGCATSSADGTDPVGVFDIAEDLAEWVRATGRPAVLHLRTVRFGGHAGTDVESAYRTAAAIRADQARDPLLATARVLVEHGAATPAERRRALPRRAGRRCAPRPTSSPSARRCATAAEVIAPLSPRRPAAVAERVACAAGARRAGAPSSAACPRTRARSRWPSRSTARSATCSPPTAVCSCSARTSAPRAACTASPAGCSARPARRRVFDTLLDEQSILGLALGAGVSGLVPIPEIQYLAYLHNAEDQLRGEAASLSFFSNGQYTNPLVVRIAGYGYQKGFGGHFHNDNGVAVLRDIPGLVIASPAHPADAPAMLRTCVAAAVADGTVSVFLEPIALYHTRDLHEPGDERWTAPYAAAGSLGRAEHVPIGAPAVARDGDDVLVVTWANGLYLSLRVAERLAADGIGCRVLDLRWLAPLPIEEVARHARAVGRVVVVDETRRSGGVGEAVVAGLVDRGRHGADRGASPPTTRSSRSATPPASSSSPRTTSSSRHPLRARELVLCSAARPAGASRRRRPCPRRRRGR